MSDARSTTPADDSTGAGDDALRSARIEAGIRAVREGHGANCSSIGSVIDTIFATAVLGGAVFAAVVAALGREKVQVAGEAREVHSASDALGSSSSKTAEERKP